MNSGGTKLVEAASADFRIGIGHGRDDAMDAGFYERLGAGRRPSLMRVGFEIDVERSAVRLLAGSFEREDFGMLHARVSVSSVTDDIAIGIGDDCAHVRIRRGLAGGGASEFKGAVQELLVNGLSGHSGMNLTCELGSGIRSQGSVKS